MVGRYFHGYTPISARYSLENVLQRGMPPRRRMVARASHIHGACGLWPASFSAKYAFTHALISLGPPW